MLQFNINELTSLGKQEKQEKQSSTEYSQSNKGVTKLPLDTTITHHGEIIGTLSDIKENLRCDCPHGYLHSDGLGDDYAHTVILPGGDIGISCSGDSCSGLFIPDTPMPAKDTGNPKLDIGQLDNWTIGHC